MCTQLQLERREFDQLTGYSVEESQAMGFEFVTDSDPGTETGTDQKVSDSNSRGTRVEWVHIDQARALQKMDTWYKLMLECCKEDYDVNAKYTNVDNKLFGQLHSLLIKNN